MKLFDLRLIFFFFHSNFQNIDPDNKGKLMDDYWGPGQKMMGDIKFIDSLRAYDKDNIPKNIMKIIREKYVNNPYFDPNLVKKVATACEGLCR